MDEALLRRSHATGVERHGDISFNSVNDYRTHRALRRVVSSSNNENRSLFGVRSKVANLEGAALSFRD
jgi:hypothetical protein